MSKAKFPETVYVELDEDDEPDSVYHGDTRFSGFKGRTIGRYQFVDSVMIPHNDGFEFLPTRGRKP